MHRHLLCLALCCCIPFVPVVSFMQHSSLAAKDIRSNYSLCHHQLQASSKRTLKTQSLTLLFMAMKVNIRIVGRKSSEPWLEEGVEMYESRLKPSNVEVDTTWHKDNDALMKGIGQDVQKNHKVICLDPNGKQTSSEVFCERLYDWLEEGGSRLSFVIGGAEGLPSELKYPAVSSSKQQSAAPPLISLSTMTFTHQFARLLLIEQIYRSTEIRKGSGYHK